jgi:hypothetical protein
VPGCEVPLRAADRRCSRTPTDPQQATVAALIHVHRQLLSTVGYCSVLTLARVTTTAFEVPHRSAGGELSNRPNGLAAIATGAVRGAGAPRGSDVPALPAFEPTAPRAARNASAITIAMIAAATLTATGRDRWER